MRKIVVIATASLILSLSSAFAQDTKPAPVGADVSEKNAPAVQPPAAVPLPPVKQVAPTPAPPVTEAPGNLKTVEKTPSPDCKLVKIYRPDVGSHPNIVVRFSNLAKADAAGKIEQCDQKIAGSTFMGFSHWSTGGFQVKFATQNGWGVVNLPIGLTDASADQVVCNPANADAPMKFATQWSGALPDEIKLQKLDSFDKEAAVVGCKAALQRLTAAERQSLGIK